MVNRTEAKLWKFFSELEREVTRLEEENNLLTEKIRQLEGLQKVSKPVPDCKRIEWVELESGKRFLTKKELGKYLGMGAGTISNQLSRGTFPIRARRVGRSVRFDMKEVLDYVETNKPFWERDNEKKQIKK